MSTGIRIIKAGGAEEASFMKSLKTRAGSIDPAVLETVRTVLDDIRENGYAAVAEYSRRFDKTEPYELTKEDLQKAVDACDPQLIDALQKAKDNIFRYHQNMVQSSWSFERVPGAVTGQIVRPLERVGIYVPGGTAAYPSSVLMNAIPAKVAGVNEIIMVTPPGRNLNNAVLAAAAISGIDRVFALGGVQAIGAMAYGADPIPQVDKITGPGNQYVAAAKRLVFGTVDIDMIAGPTEVVIIADKTADPAYLAADLMSQAEHDVMASAILLTDDAELAYKVKEEIEKQVRDLERKDIILSSFENFGAIVLFDSIKEALEYSDKIAPEHLELVLADAESALQDVHHAGAVFLGEYSPEPLGDYMAGPCHVLPTSGTARFSSPLSVDSFIKKMSVIQYEKQPLLDLADEIEILAQAEGLTAHANSITVRRKKQ